MKTRTLWMVIGMLLLPVSIGCHGNATLGGSQRPSGDARRVALTDEQKAAYEASLRLPQVVALRKALDSYLAGTDSAHLDEFAVKGSPDLPFTNGLASFKRNYFTQKFVLLTGEPNPVGGENLHIVSQERPDKVFCAWMYKTPSAWVLRGIWESPLFRDKQKTRQVLTEYADLFSRKGFGF